MCTVGGVGRRALHVTFWAVIYIFYRRFFSKAWRVLATVWLHTPPPFCRRSAWEKLLIYHTGMNLSIIQGLSSGRELGKLPCCSAANGGLKNHSEKAPPLWGDLSLCSPKRVGYEPHRLRRCPDNACVYCTATCPTTPTTFATLMTWCRLFPRGAGGMTMCPKRTVPMPAGACSNSIRTHKADSGGHRGRSGAILSSTAYRV
jgi:hypothetical protein